MGDILGFKRFGDDLFSHLNNRFKGDYSQNGSLDEDYSQNSFLDEDYSQNSFLDDNSSDNDNIFNTIFRVAYGNKWEEKFAVYEAGKYRSEARKYLLDLEKDMHKAVENMHKSRTDSGEIYKQTYESLRKEFSKLQEIHFNVEDNFKADMYEGWRECVEIIKSIAQGKLNFSFDCLASLYASLTMILSNNDNSSSDNKSNDQWNNSSLAEIDLKELRKKYDEKFQEPKNLLEKCLDDPKSGLLEREINWFNGQGGTSPGRMQGTGINSLSEDFLTLYKEYLYATLDTLMPEGYDPTKAENGDNIEANEDRIKAIAAFLVINAFVSQDFEKGITFGRMDSNVTCTENNTGGKTDEGISDFEKYSAFFRNREDQSNYVATTSVFMENSVGKDHKGFLDCHYYSKKKEKTNDEFETYNVCEVLRNKIRSLQ